MRWNTGGSVNTTSYRELESFLVDGVVTDRALQDAIRMSGWSIEELRFGLNKVYAVDLAGVSRFLDSDAGEAFLQDQTKSYVPYWRQKTTAAMALRAAIIADATDGLISSIGIMKQLPGSLIPTRVKPFCRIKQGLIFLIGAKRRRRPWLCGPPSSRMPRMGSLALSES